MNITTNEFKLLSLLPEGYIYKIHEINNRKVVIGVEQADEIIGYYFDNGMLESIYLSCMPDIVKK